MGSPVSRSRTAMVVGLMAVACGVATAYVIASSTHVVSPTALTILTLLASWSFVGAGLVAQAKRPGNNVGVLMIAIGFAVLLWSLKAADEPKIFIAGVLGSHLAAVLLGHLLMVYPSGHFDMRAGRWLVMVGYVDAILLTLPATLVLDTQGRFAGYPPNPLMLNSNDDLFVTISIVRLTLDACLTTGLAIALTRRWYAAYPSQRAAMAPVIWSGGITLGLFAVMFVSEVAGGRAGALGVLDLAALAAASLVPFAFVFGLIRGRFTRAGAVGDLVATLAGNRAFDGDLRDTLATALGDPSIEFAYWLPERGHYVDASGRVVRRTELNSGRVWHEVERNGELLAAIIHDEFLRDESALVGTAGRAAALVLENQRLAAELRAHVKELEASRARIVQATDKERKRIERNLHDGAQQHLLMISMKLRIAQTTSTNNQPELTALLEEIAGDLERATDDLRELARGIHPAILTDFGLSDAVEALAQRMPMRVNLVELPDRRLPPDVESVAYYVVAEAIANVAKYARADQVSVTIVADDFVAIVVVRDDGVGGADPSAGSGLRGLADRVAVLDGKLEVISPHGQGTVIRATMCWSSVSSIPLQTPETYAH